jgi:hypothetical protein
MRSKEAAGYTELVERFGYTQEQLSDVIGKSRSHLANTMRLLKLPPEVRGLIQEGKLTAGHGRALVGRDDAAQLAAEIVERQLNVRAAEALVQNIPRADQEGGSGSQPARRKEKDADTRAFEKDLADGLGLKVEIKAGSGESGCAHHQVRQLRPARLSACPPAGFAPGLTASNVMPAQAGTHATLRWPDKISGVDPRLRGDDVCWVADDIIPPTAAARSGRASAPGRT